MYRGKIFVIGFPRTGTRSCVTSLGMLGFRVSHMHQTGVRPYEMADVFGDTPVWTDWRDLARQYENAKFVLTVREVESWWKSFEKNLLWYWQKLCHDPFDRLVKQIDANAWRRYLKTTPATKGGLVDAYQRHNREIATHFNGSKKFLTVDVSHKGDYGKLVKFVNCTVDDLSFPVVK
jgi:hypothetical protein